MENDYLYKDLNYAINGCAFDAFKEVGVGFDEPTYHKFFRQCLLDKGLKARYKVPLQAFYRNEKIADFEADEIVEDCIIVEAFDEIRTASTEYWDEGFFLNFFRKPALDEVLSSTHAVD